MHYLHYFHYFSVNHYFALLLHFLQYLLSRITFDLHYFALLSHYFALLAFFCSTRITLICITFAVLALLITCIPVYMKVSPRLKSYFGQIPFLSLWTNSFNFWPKIFPSENSFFSWRFRWNFNRDRYSVIGLSLRNRTFG